MNPYLSEKARGEIPRVLKWLRNAGLAFCVFCSVGGLYTLCLDLQAKDTSHVVEAMCSGSWWAQCPLFCSHATKNAATMQEPSPAGWRATPGRRCLCGGCATALAWTLKDLAWYFENGYFANLSLDTEPEDRPQADRAPP